MDEGCFKECWRTNHFLNSNVVKNFHTNNWLFANAISWRTPKKNTLWRHLADNPSTQYIVDHTLQTLLYYESFTPTTQYTQPMCLGVNFINPFTLYAQLLCSAPNFWEVFFKAYKFGADCKSLAQSVRAWRRAQMGLWNRALSQPALAFNTNAGHRAQTCAGHHTVSSIPATGTPPGGITQPLFNIILL